MQGHQQVSKKKHDQINTFQFSNQVTDRRTPEYPEMSWKYLNLATRPLTPRVSSPWPSGFLSFLILDFFSLKLMLWGIWQEENTATTHHHSNITRVNVLWRVSSVSLYLLEANFQVALSLLLVVWKGLIDEKLLINMCLMTNTVKYTILNLNSSRRAGSFCDKYSPAGKDGCGCSLKTREQLLWPMGFLPASSLPPFWAPLELPIG